MPRTLAVLAVIGGGLAVAGLLLASDHQDTPEVELSPRFDVNDVYAFPAATAGRMVLVLGTSSPLTPAGSAGAVFDPGQLYQIKIDNNGDAVEDVVLQFVFEGTGPSQTVSLIGPSAPSATGIQNRILDADAAISGPINTVLGSSSGIQLFAGLREDPFFIDLEQFFRIIPDRAPVQGPLSKIGPKQEATSFRDPGVDFLAGINTLAIVVELPESMLLPSGAGADPKIGVWATTSR